MKRCQDCGCFHEKPGDYCSEHEAEYKPAVIPRADRRFTRFMIRRVVDGMMTAYQSARDADGISLMDSWDSVDMGALADSYPVLRKWKYGGRGNSIENKARAVLTAMSAGLVRERRATISNLCSISPVWLDAAEVGLGEQVRRGNPVKHALQAVLEIFKEKTIDEYSQDIKRRCPALNCEICGTWLWVSGSLDDMKRSSAFLRSRGLRYISRKGMWAIASREEMKWSRQELVPMHIIYQKYGRKVVN